LKCRLIKAKLADINFVVWRRGFLEVAGWLRRCGIEKHMVGVVEEWLE
jgi:hypothetical protein